MTERRWKLDPGLAAILATASEVLLPEHVQTIRAEITAGVISEQTRRILVEWRWITPRDGRLTPEATTTTSQPRRGTEAQ